MNATVGTGPPSILDETTGVMAQLHTGEKGSSNGD